LISAGLTGTLGNHQIEIATQVIQSVCDHRPQIAAPGPEVLLRGLDAVYLATHHDLTRAAALRFEQNRIHVHGRYYAGGGRLGILRAADFAAVRTNGGVI
jgi:hypothetical protein